jgi:hypothetical protein
VTSQTYLICRPKNLTSSSVIEPTRIGASVNISCLRDATTRVGSFSRAEAYSKTPSTGSQGECDPPSDRHTNGPLTEHQASVLAPPPQVSPSSWGVLDSRV